MMGGDVGVVSRPGSGSTFWFTARLRWGSPCEAVAPIEPPAAQPNVLGGARILLVEDNLLNLEVASGMLRSVGADVTHAVNGREAVDLLLTRCFDCVLMDVQMPVMDGLEATRLIRSDHRLAPTPVIAMTANAGPADRVRCIEAGMDDFVSKPVDWEQLLATVVKWMPGRPDIVPDASTGLPAADEPAPMEAAREPVDLSILSRSVAGDAQKVRRYAGMFVDEIPENLAELQALWASRDLPRLADLGHRWKASSKLIGAVALAAQCQLLEDFRYHGTPEQAGAVVQAIPALLAEVTASIARELA